MKMNKKMLGVLVLAGLALNASANLTSFRWYNTAVSNLVNNGNVAIAANGATVLTYLSTDNVINFNPAVLLSNTYGNDTYYKVLANSLVGRLTTTFMDELVTDNRGKFAYAIILDVPLTTFNTTYGGLVANVPAGTWYDVTPISAALANMDIIPAPTSQSFNAGTLKTDTQVIPEPATALLFGIGAMGAWMIRRNKIKSKEQADA